MSFSNVQNCAKGLRTTLSGLFKRLNKTHVCEKEAKCNVESVLSGTLPEAIPLQLEKSPALENAWSIAGDAGMFQHRSPDLLLILGCLSSGTRAGLSRRVQEPPHHDNPCS